MDLLSLGRAVAIILSVGVSLAVAQSAETAADTMVVAHARPVAETNGMVGLSVGKVDEPLPHEEIPLAREQNRLVSDRSNLLGMLASALIMFGVVLAPSLR